MKLLSTLLAALLTLASAAAWAAPGDGLDGTNWKMRRKDILSRVQFWKYDHLTFKDGTFISIDCKEHGYSPAQYKTIATADGAVTFLTLMQGKDGGSVSWSGTRKGDMMWGQFTWKKEDGASRTYNWTAKPVAHEHPEHPAAAKAPEPKAAPAAPAAPAATAAPAAPPATAAPAPTATPAATATPAPPAAPAATATPAPPAAPAASQPASQEHPSGHEHPAGQEHPR